MVKALCRALRSLIRHDRRAVEAFLAEHDEVLAAGVRREVHNELERGLTNPGRTRPGRAR
ncbi:MAG: DNA alkylation repair protein [Firmicutes bacterium]|nr:DNA alkylation repair protein [Bacillota bacterium]